MPLTAGQSASFYDILGPQGVGDLGEEPEPAPGLRVMLGICGEQAVNPEYDALRQAEPELAGSLWDSLK